MKVGYVLGTTTGGTGSHVAMLAQECAARGIRVRVFGPADTGQRFFPARTAAPAGPAGSTGPDKAPGFAVVDISDRPRPARDLAAVLRLRRLLRAWDPDVVHAHGLRAGALTALALTGAPTARIRPPRRDRSVLLKTFQSHYPSIFQDREKGGHREQAGSVPAGRRRRRCAFVVTVHNAPSGGGATGFIYRVLERIVARKADAVTWVSGDLGARMRRAGAPDGGRALVPAPEFTRPSADQIAAVRASLGGEHRPVVLAAGRLVPQKGYQVLLKAASRWQRRDPVPLLAIAGEGPLAGPLAEQARSAGIAVCFLGQRADVPALLGAADVVVVPSVWEGQPLILQEALRMGRPVVAARTGGIPDMTGEDAALLVPPGDQAALAAAVESVLDDPGLAARLGAAAVQRAGELPSAGDAVDSVTRRYHRLLRAADRSPARGHLSSGSIHPRQA
jgi:glycosyltransferase involved in cell wall biosynthesis